MSETELRRNGSLPFLPGLLLLYTIFLLSFTPAAAQNMSSKKLIQKILRKHPENFREILENPETYRVQILYTLDLPNSLHPERDVWMNHWYVS